MAMITFFLTKYSKWQNTYTVTVKFKSCNMFLFFLSSLSMYDADRLWSMVNIWDISFRNSSQQPIYTIKSVNRTKLPCTVPPPPHPAMQHHSLFKNITPLFSTVVDHLRYNLQSYVWWWSWQQGKIFARMQT